MTFVNEYISLKDRESYRLESFDKKLPLINPQGDWAIDREQQIFLRVIRPAARKSEPGDPNAHFEKDFHYHWKGFDFLVSTRSGLGEQEFQSWPGEIFKSNCEHNVNAHVLRFYLRYIGEISGAISGSSNILSLCRHEVLSDLEHVLGTSWGGYALFYRQQRRQKTVMPLLKWECFKLCVIPFIWHIIEMTQNC